MRLFSSTRRTVPQSPQPRRSRPRSMEVTDLFLLFRPAYSACVLPPDEPDNPLIIQMVHLRQQLAQTLLAQSDQFLAIRRIQSVAADRALDFHCERQHILSVLIHVLHLIHHFPDHEDAEAADSTIFCRSGNIRLFGIQRIVRLARPPVRTFADQAASAWWQPAPLWRFPRDRDT